MHPEVRGWVAKIAPRLKGNRIVEVGSRQINGTVRDLIPATWIGVDLEDGDGVDWQGDFLDYWPDRKPDGVVCCEVLEHAVDPVGLVGHAWDILKPSGWLLVTCATEGRAEHSAVDGGPLRAGEHYQNVTPFEPVGFTTIVEEVHADRGDWYVLWRKV